MTGPFIGPLDRDDHAGLCSYSDRPGEPLCLAEATWHGIFTDEHGEIDGGLVSCDRHEAIMRALVLWVHPHDVPCGLPDARFFEDVNLCAVPWDDDDVALMATAMAEAQP